MHESLARRLTHHSSPLFIYKNDEDNAYPLGTICFFRVYELQHRGAGRGN